jgi:GcrA cell cycle regulator
MSNAFDTQARRAEHDWTTDEISRLTQLWAEGLSGTEIGRCLGITKSAAIGKVRRLRLPGRPSPIRARPIYAREATSPQRAAYTPPDPIDQCAAAASLEARHREFAAMSVEKGQPCQFPLWGDERPTHEYCGHARVAGKPYCAAHCAVAYVKAPPPAGQAPGQGA